MPTAKKKSTQQRKGSSPDGAGRYRKFALALPGAVESSHMGAADFRANDRIFATLAYVDRNLGTLKFTPEQQAAVLAESEAGMFQPAPGGWGRTGMTLLSLDAPDDVMKDALATAHRNVVAKAARSQSAKSSGTRASAKRTTNAE